MEQKPDPTATQSRQKPSGLDALRAIMLLTAHLTDVLPLLMAVRRVPPRGAQRITLVQGIAQRVARDPQLAQDFYQALGLLAGEDISAMSAADLVTLSFDLLRAPAVGDIWQAAYTLGLLNEETMGQWVLYDSLIGG